MSILCIQKIHSSCSLFYYFLVFNIDYLEDIYNTHAPNVMNVILP